MKKKKEKKEQKQFIVYRKGYSIFTREEYVVREELTKQELEKYLIKYINEIDNIEVFNINDKINVEVDIKFKLDALIKTEE